MKGKERKYFTNCVVKINKDGSTYRGIIYWAVSKKNGANLLMTKSYSTLGGAIRAVNYMTQSLGLKFTAYSYTEEYHDTH
jgi:hypothetical protein